jgi:predicted metal-binding membrane protein
VATIALAPTRLGRSARALLIGALLVAAGVAWAVTDLRMAGMGGGTELGALGFYVGVWVVMMAAMMFPSVWPMIVAYHAIAHRRRELGKPAPAAGGIVFLAGYLIAWTLYGLTAYGAIEAVRALDVEALGWNRGGPYVAGAVIVAAAAYQLTPAKDVCLRKCRSPMHFFFGIWRDGVSGALRMGIEHGAWCVGCCWALMAGLFALGAMSLGWMAFVGALIAIEKLLPWKALANHGVAVVLVVLGLAVIASPASVPGLGPTSMSMSKRPMSNGPGASTSPSIR